MRRSGAAAAVCKEDFLASVYRDKDPADTPIRGVPGNQRFADLFTCWNWIRVSSQSWRLFLQQAKRAFVSLWVGWSRVYRIADREV